MHATARTIDLRNKAAAVLEINTWAAKNTHDRIRDVVDESNFKPLTGFVMANAVYFLGKWQTPFEVSSTSKRGFVLADGKKVLVRHDVG